MTLTLNRFPLLNGATAAVLGYYPKTETAVHKQNHTAAGHTCFICSVASTNCSRMPGSIADGQHRHDHIFRLGPGPGEPVGATNQHTMS
jgi:hypothetical protein